jgi:DNA-nicking Smr family endonuclease
MRENQSATDLETKIFAAELRTDMPSIDVHGHYPDNLSARLDQFIYTHRNESSLQVIHGHGKGVLKQKVLDICRNHPLIDAVVEKNGYVLLII